MSPSEDNAKRTPCNALGNNETNSWSSCWPWWPSFRSSGSISSRWMAWSLVVPPVVIMDIDCQFSSTAVVSTADSMRRSYRLAAGIWFSGRRWSVAWWRLYRAAGHSNWRTPAVSRPNRWRFPTLCCGDIALPPATSPSSSLNSCNTNSTQKKTSTNRWIETNVRLWIEKQSQIQLINFQSLR